MTHYSVQSRDCIFVKGCGFFSFAKNVVSNIGKNVRKHLSGRYSQKLLVHAKRSATDAIKTASKREIQKTAEATSNLIGNKITNETTRVTKPSPQNNSETNEEEALGEKYVPPELRYKIIDDLTLKII